MPGAVNVSGTWHPWVPDINLSGGWHGSSLWVNVGGTWRPAVVAFSITAGEPSPPPPVQIGYVSGSYGSIARASLGLGRNIVELVDIGSGAVFGIGGFSADPGAALATSITANGVTLTFATATYSYSGGTATWGWASSFGFVNGNSYNCILR